MLAMPFHARENIRRVLDEAVRCIKAGEEFIGTIKLKNKEGPKFLILPGSSEESLIATWIDSHVGSHMTAMLVNEY